MQKVNTFTLMIITVLYFSSCSISPDKSSQSLSSTPAGVNPAFTNIDTYNPGTGWAVAWSDEFSAPAINSSVWSCEVFPGSPPNGEWETYTSSGNNSYIDNFSGNGMLVIKAIYKGGGLAKGNFTSARIISANKKTFQYGKIAARIMMPYGTGIWPAFWMLGANISELGGTQNWPGCGEIDIVEVLGHAVNTMYETIHGPIGTLSGSDYNGGSGFGSGALNQGADLSQGFHVYEAEWSSTSITFRFDGIPYYTISSNTVVSSGGLWVFNRPFFILFNLAVGGGWPGNPDITTVFPQYMYVDWVRQYTN